MKKGYEKVLGTDYKIGSKGWQTAKDKVKQFNDLAEYENR